jgi:hypothetical protein
MAAYCPLNPKSRFPKGYSVIFGAEDNPSFRPDPAAGLMRVQYQYRVGKIGLDSAAGWVATGVSAVFSSPPQLNRRRPARTTAARRNPR